MTDPLTPTTHVITSTRSRDGEPTSTTVVKETHFALQGRDTLILGLSAVVLERGGYGDQLRETVRLERYDSDIVSNAVVALLQHAAGELSQENFGAQYGARCENLLRRVAAVLPPHLLDEARQPRLTVVVSNSLEA